MTDEMKIKTYFYLCNPEKNTKCIKSHCYINNGPCSLTTDPDKAFTDENGEPIKEDNK